MREQFRPKRIAPKVKAIRQRLGISQTGMHQILEMKGYYNRISDYERGKRIPSLRTLLAYGRAGKVPLEQIVDDELELTF